MDIILLQDVDKVGDKLDIVKVKPGYGRNFLIPRGLAMVANATNRAKIDEIKSKEAELQAGRLDEAKVLAAKIEAAIIKIGAKAGESGKIFGSVTNVQLAAALKEQLDIDVERKNIILNDEVKELGSYEAKVKVHPSLSATLKYEVAAD